MLADAAESVADQSGVVLFLLLFVGPAGWFFIQSSINDVASGV